MKDNEKKKYGYLLIVLLIVCAGIYGVYQSKSGPSMSMLCLVNAYPCSEGVYLETYKGYDLYWYGEIWGYTSIEIHPPFDDTTWGTIEGARNRIDEHLGTPPITPTPTQTTPVPTQTTPVPTYNCADGTLNLACSSQKPLYCYYGSLINKASQCGCPTGQTPSGDSCIVVSPTQTTPGQTTPPPVQTTTNGNNGGDNTNLMVLSGIIMVVAIGLLFIGRKKKR